MDYTTTFCFIIFQSIALLYHCEFSLNLKICIRMGSIPVETYLFQQGDLMGLACIHMFRSLFDLYTDAKNGVIELKDFKFCLIECSMWFGFYFIGKLFNGPLLVV